MRNIKTGRNILMSMVLLTSILLTTIVYSAFSTQMQIDGQAIVRSDNDIRLTNIIIREKTNGAYETYNNKYTRDVASMFVTLPSNSSIIYEIEVTNKSSSIYTLVELNELTSLNNNLSYEIDTEQYDIYDPGVRKITITIINNSNDEIKDNIILEFKFDIAKSMFISGHDFNSKIKTLAGNINATYETEDNNIENIVRADVLNTQVTSDNIVSTDDSTIPIYAWYDSGTIYYYTKYERPKLDRLSDYMFNRLLSVVNIDISTVDTSNVTNMGGMFYKCSATELDLSSFDTSHVTDMNRMFFYSEATVINGLDKFDTSKVISMIRMFSASSSTILDLSNFDTSNVTNMDCMFERSEATTIKGLNNFNTSKVTGVYNLFANTQVTNLDLSSFNTSKITNMAGMFSNSKVTSLDLSSFDTSNVTLMNSMFSNTQAVVINGLNNFDTSKVTNMRYMFNNSQVTDLDLSSFDTSNVTDMTRMFAYSMVTNLNLSNFDTSKVTDMTSMFEYCRASNINLDGFDTRNVINMTRMLSYTFNVASLDLSSFDTSNVTNMYGMFSHSQVTTIKGLEKFNTSKVTDMSYLFSWCKLSTLDLSSFDTSNVINMEGMFYTNNNLTTIYTSDKFITSKATNSTDMFLASYKLVGGNGTKYNDNYIDKTYARIDTSELLGYFTLKNN